MDILKEYSKLLNFPVRRYTRNISVPPPTNNQRYAIGVIERHSKAQFTGNSKWDAMDFIRDNYAIYKKAQENKKKK